MDLLDKYKFKIKKDNCNCLWVYTKENKLHTFIALPPIQFGIDIINCGAEFKEHYTHNFEGLVVITTPDNRKIYHKGKLVLKIDRT